VAPTTDFSAWVVPDLVLTLGGRTYTVQPPSVSRARQVLALSIASDAQLARRDLPESVQTVVDAITDPLAVVTLGQDVYDQLVADGVPAEVVKRMGFYGLHFWTSGKDKADRLAQALWAADDGEWDGADPKAPAAPRSRSRSGRSTASGSRTRKASTRTTASPPT
jgi:hypothetical protein